MLKDEKSGFLERDYYYMREAAERDPAIETLILFGSRALGNYKAGSDVDLAVKGAQVDRFTILSLSERLNEELPLPYFFDVLEYDAIENEALKNHIDRYGIVIYRRNSNHNAEVFSAELVREGD